MDRRTRRPPTVDELVARAAARGYKRGAHIEKDKVRKQGKHNSTTKTNQNATLHRYDLWTLYELRDTAIQQGLSPPNEEMAREHCLRPEMKVPDLATIKDFIRFYAATSDPRIDEEVSTVDSLNTVAEWFFAGFARVTKTEIKEEDRKEVYDFVRTTLVEEGLAVNKHRPKYNFTVEVLTLVQITLWTKDDLIFIPERYRIQTTFITNVYCWTGARISAFFTGGFRYGDTEIVLQRAEGSRHWRATWRLDQRWVKNNRDPDNIVVRIDDLFGTAHREHEMFIYNETGFLLQMALADGALFGIHSIKDLLKKRIPYGENVLVLRYNESALKKPILRKCTKEGGVTDEPMPKSAFVNIWRSNCSNAGLFEIPTIHAIRRGLGKKVDKNYTPVQRSQHLTQADLGVFGQSYVANCSSVDGQAAFLGEPSDHRHIEYFQSVERFLEPGLPNELPARRLDELSRDPRLCELQEQLASLEREGTTGPVVNEAKRWLSNYRRKLYKKALRGYQQWWVRDRRDWKILTNGQERPNDPSNTDLVQHLSLLIPERGRLAQWMCQDEPLSPESMWQAMRDLHSLCTRDLTVLYLPGLNPREGRCPVKSCQKLMDDLPKNRRNHHIQTCVHHDMAKKLRQLPSHIHYCHLCFNWVVGEDEWESHCASHLSSLATKRCGTLSYGYTLVRPAYSPFRLGKKGLSAADRLQSWNRDFDLWKEVNKEIQRCRWPMMCPYPLCDVSLTDDRDLRFHFIDDHKLSRTRPGRSTAKDLPPKVTASIRPHSPDEKLTLDEGADGIRSCRKRKSPSSSGALKWMPPQSLDSTAATSEKRLPDRPPKRKKQKQQTPSPSTICPEVIVIDEEVSDDYAAPSTVDSIMFFPPGPLGIEDDDKCTDLKCDPFPRHCVTSIETIHSLESADCNDNSNLDVIFDQYLRSPSLSPPPSPPGSSEDGATSESSGATLIHAERDLPRGGAELHTETVKSPVLEEVSDDVSRREGARDEEGHLSESKWPSRSTAGPSASNHAPP
ncbi:uncharacterized protein Z518_11114 [Rhinocladiella mackenziei CBS 650.93]|uniref:Uncharacterized protein n=1 Tax=Rhinocladiella mackenziei CBS 650.93 TaxID=1442369 RepID=A0A0D2FC65_9EURO|nr:uncharacterized protein Z518_11114 [Rhinocladiella mackenziei CBS 650.93]KIW99701.1 hypothetical protein Z518_11114 [Rhinocladiella mackenziei CBS 650.93]